MDIKLHELEAITDNFSDKHIVGKGGFGDVYKGVYKGEEIALKRLHQFQGLDDKEFKSEFLNLRNIHHKNVVRLIGYCHEARNTFVEHKGQMILAKAMERVLCFQYMRGGSLDRHISDEPCHLDWPTCYKIIKGGCEGVNHLHSAQGKPIYHLDLKPANILLDTDFTPKIADLGLSRLVTSSQTQITTATQQGTLGYMPPEYLDQNYISPKYDVFSLGVIIIKIMAGNTSYPKSKNETVQQQEEQQFVELVTQSWKKRLQSTSRYSSQEIGILQLQVKTCVEIALRCVNADRNKRPRVKDIVIELDELEAKIKEMSLSSEKSEDLTGQRSSDSNILSVDPTLELRFPFKPGTEIPCCLQLTNKTDRCIAYNIKINQSKYYVKPSRGIVPPCSKCYISVTLRAQEAPPNMQCYDMFLVQSVSVGEGLASDDITEDLFEKAMEKMVVDVVKLPIVFVAQ